LWQRNGDLEKRETSGRGVRRRSNVRERGRYSEEDRNIRTEVEIKTELVTEKEGHR